MIVGFEEGNCVVGFPFGGFVLCRNICRPGRWVSAWLQEGSGRREGLDCSQLGCWCKWFLEGRRGGWWRLSSSAPNRRLLLVGGG